ncbi:hypothetical protein [Fictibacillus phosphorivorans]|uniref:hypothetical protein n=1 Tax=Fictibacillus phosphorivorans TaxID=1221500 RepID=UPI00203E1953|nr:hypothetical protein [Fictibacillus phosphorivorans]MCM3716828.1 hypothetical protein [Fictibacillus phosphorivorans]MCM3774623.1 hypothetical protein [Fictibacillus phosphorivorans]
MFEYWIFHDQNLEIHEDHDLREMAESTKENGDRIWLFHAKNLLVIQSNAPFGDGNLILDDLLIKLAKRFEIHDKGIIKSCW